MASAKMEANSTLDVTLVLTRFVRLTPIAARPAGTESAWVKWAPSAASFATKESRNVGAQPPNVALHNVGAQPSNVALRNVGAQPPNAALLNVGFA